MERLFTCLRTSQWLKWSAVRSAYFVIVCYRAYTFRRASALTVRLCVACRSAWAVVCGRSQRALFSDFSFYIVYRGLSRSFTRSQVGVERDSLRQPSYSLQVQEQIFPQEEESPGSSTLDNHYDNLCNYGEYHDLCPIGLCVCVTSNTRHSTDTIFMKGW